MSLRLVFRLTLAAGAFALVAPAIATAAPTGWTVQFGSSDHDYGVEVAVDGSGNVYVGGYTYGTLGTSTFGNTDAFVRKLDRDGNVKWTKQFGTSGDEIVDGLAVTSSGDSYVVGKTSGSLARPLEGPTDAFVAKYDKNGNQKWVKQFGGTDGDAATGVAVAKSGNIYVTGYTLVLGSVVEATLTKFDKNGNQKWQRVVATPAYDSFVDVAVSSSEDVYVAGDTDGDVVGVNQGYDDVIVARYDKNGNQKWIRQVGTSGLDRISDIDVTAKGEPRVLGHSEGTLPGATPANAGATDGFLLAFDKNGTQQWATMFGTAQYDVGYALDISAAGVLYVTGRTDGQFPEVSVSSGLADAVLATFSSLGVRTSVRQYILFYIEMTAIAIRKGSGHGGPIVIAGATENALFGHTNAGVTDAFVMTLPS